MAESVLNKHTHLSGEEVITRAIQFFSTESWRATSQSSRAVTFAGRPPIPWLMLFGTIIGFIFCLIPGIIMYFLVIKKVTRFQNLVVTTTTITNATEVVVTYPSHAKKLAERFLATLPEKP